MLEIFEKRYNSLPKDLLQKVRRKGWDAFIRLGIPKPLESVRTFAAKQEPVSLPDFLCPYCIVFVNGYFRPELSKLPADPKISILDLKDGMASYSAYLSGHFSEAIKTETSPFASLNLALHEEGTLIYLSPGSKLSLQILHLVDQKNTIATPRVHFFAGKGAEADLIETFVEKTDEALLNAAAEYVLDAGAKVHVSSNKTAVASGSSHISTLRAYLKRDCVFAYASATCGSRYSKEDLKVFLNGENSFASLFGAWSLREKNESHYLVHIHHSAPHCSSRQLFKGLLQDSSRSSFEGKIYVEKQAQKTDAFQLNNNLLIGQTAHADTRPNLEIFADDVKASHGATVGQLDPEVLFYLKTRGISQEAASALLIKGYFQEVVEEVRCPVAL